MDTKGTSDFLCTFVSLQQTMKVVVDDKIPYIRGQVERLADEVVYLPGSQIAAGDVRDADALIIRTRTYCNRQLLEGSRVRFIATATIGYDHIDTEYLQEAGIQWTNCPGCNATSVAQYVRNSLFVAEQQGIIRLSEATVGIVGYGHVGMAVYNALQPYVKEVLLNDPPLFEREEERSSIYYSLSTLHERCDIITLHTPLTYDGQWPTFHLVDKQFLANLKRQPILINAARGEVVDSKALEEALDEGLVCQAIIDTWEDEPHINRSLLDKVFIGTPHIAGYSADGKANATRMVLHALSVWMGRAEQFDIQPLSLPEDFIPAQDERELALQLYNPITDSLRLKQTPDSFEEQRSAYPLRREVYG